jgi:hypothetical protein
VNITPEDVAECRARDGAAADDRPEYVAEWASESPEVGFCDGLPLWGDYEQYPHGDDLYRPDARAALKGVAEHGLAENPEDVAAELGTDLQHVERAADLHGVTLPEGGDGGDDESADTLTLPCGEEWDLAHLADPPESDSRILSALLARDRLSLAEAAEYLTDELGKGVRAADLRDHALAAGLLEGERQSRGGNTGERARPELTNTVPPQGNTLSE